MTTRRDLLTALLGAPLAAAACRRQAQWSYDGAIVGQDAPHGHRLRNASENTVHSRVERAQIVVVGAGPSGLACAHALQQSMPERDAIVVLELESVVGGTSRSGQNQITRFPWGAHYVPTPLRENQDFVALLRAMNVLESNANDRVVVREEFLVRDLDERIFFEGHWHDGLYPQAGATEEDRAQLLRFQQEINRWVRFRGHDGRRAFALPSSLCSADERVRVLDSQTMAQWLDARGFTSSRLRWLVDYACRDDYGLKASRCSAWAGLFYFASRVRNPGEPAEELIAFPEGNGRFVQWLSDRLGDRVRTQQLVRSIALREDGGVSIHCEDLARGDTLRIDAQRVVLAIPSFVAERLTPVVRATAAAPITRSYSPWIVANLTLSSRPTCHDGSPEMAWDNVLYDSPALGYVCATHQSLRDHGPTVLTWYLPLCGDDPASERRKLLAMDWRACADAAVSDLVRAHPDLPKRVTRVDVMRWGHAMARPVPGFLALRGDPDGTTQDPRVFVAHTDRSGLALFEESYDRGVLTARAVLRSLAAPASEPVA
ncbi:MAG: FAD-dependent oxidoreductase [Deltaproteobacteria bacterium]|nr:FAD-dependent oxidoreductase [Deltaproteobacteria bacterium]